MNPLPSAKTLAKRQTGRELLESMKTDTRPDAEVYARAVELQLSQKKLDFDELLETLLDLLSTQTELATALLGVPPVRKKMGRTSAQLNRVLEACIASDGWEILLKHIWGSYRAPTAAALVRSQRADRIGWLVDQGLFRSLDNDHAARAWHHLDAERRSAADEDMLDKFWGSRAEIKKALKAYGPIEPSVADTPASAGLDRFSEAVVALWGPHLEAVVGRVVALRPDDGQRTPHLLMTDDDESVVVGIAESTPVVVASHSDDDEDCAAFVALMASRKGIPESERWETLLEVVDAAHDLCFLEALTKAAPNVEPKLAGHDETPYGLVAARQRWVDACQECGEDPSQMRQWLLDDTDSGWLTLS